jgi:hypothetical protein
VKLPPRSPNLNAYAERFVRSIKESCLNRLILFGERSLRRAIREFVAHYHHERSSGAQQSTDCSQLKLANRWIGLPPRTARWPVELLLSIRSLIFNARRVSGPYGINHRSWSSSISAHCKQRALNLDCVPMTTLGTSRQKCDSGSAVAVTSAKPLTLKNRWFGKS